MKAAFFQTHRVPLVKAYLLNHVTAIVGNSQDKVNTMFLCCVATCFRHLVQREGSSACGKRNELSSLKTLSNTVRQQDLMENITHIQLYFSSSVSSRSKHHLILTTVQGRF